MKKDKMLVELYVAVVICSVVFYLLRKKNPELPLELDTLVMECDPVPMEIDSDSEFIFKEKHY